MNTAGDSLPFDVDSCWSTLVKACEAVSVDSSDAVLIRLGENALFHLPSEGLVARIARGMDILKDAKKELDVGRWLATEGIDAAEPASFEQPVMEDDRPVTFWTYIEAGEAEATPVQLGSVLRQLHGLAPPAVLGLPQHDMFGRVNARILNATSIPAADRDFLTTRLHELQRQYSNLSFPLQESAIHGDAHTGNLIRRSDNSVALIDLERFAYGHPETDLAVTATEYKIGWHSDSDYKSFVGAYGFDVIAWDGFTVVQAAGELKMTTWLMQNLGHNSAIDAEIHRRLSDLRHPERPRNWSPF